MTALTTQRLIGAVFLVLGAWALLAPASVIALAVTPEYRNFAFLTLFAIACFGAQALLFALVAFTARFTRLTFLAYGVALLPFLVFNAYFHLVVPVLSAVGMVDLLGNVVMLALCWHGWRVAAR